MRYEGEYAPEVLDAWDENCLDENYEGFEESLAKIKSQSDFADVRVLAVDVPDEAVYDLFEVPVVSAAVVESAHD
jgi:hypothetical protein